MKALKSALTGTIHTLRGHPHTRADDALQAAVQTHSRRFAETQYQQMMINFYAEQAAAVNPEYEWRHFANMKDKWHDHSLEFQVEARRTVEAGAKVAACRKRLSAVKEIAR